MKKLHLFSFLITLCIFACMIFPVHGTGTDVTDQISFFDAEEYDRILAVIQDASKSTEDTLPSETQKGYKLYTVSNPDIAESFATKTAISELMGSTYYWIVPTKQGGYIRLSQADGNWQVIGWQHPSANGTSDGKLVNQETVKSALQGFLTKITNLYCFEAAAYDTNFVYFQTGGTEYLIPFGSRPDFTGLENGKSYTRQEVQSILPPLSGGSKNGGFGDAEVYFVIGIVALTLGVGFVVLQKTRKKTSSV